ncbi:MAG: PIG-L family deacetylase [Mucilaginibacter sp.]|nr:PIG-L family deacetylase [Mucilaginibacter sp.]
MTNPFNKSSFEQAAVPVNKGFLQNVRSCLVLAPHPDDESLGCGGLIALLREQGSQVTIVVTTDGSQSHPNSIRFPENLRVELRKKEIILALSILGVEKNDIYFLNGRDSGLPYPDMPGFSAFKEQISSIIEKVNPQLCLVPYELDPHCDHRATWQMLNAALADVDNNGITVWEYPIWLYHLAQPADIPDPGNGELLYLEISKYIERKKAAISAHVSQVTKLISDDPTGFMLSENMIDGFLTGKEYFMQRSVLKKERTLPAAYFQQLYKSNRDPWGFETSAYEQRKYEDTIAHLSRERYGRGLEIGCSIGVLTNKLQSRCKSLLAIDISEVALQVARERLKEYPQVCFELRGIPGPLPKDHYDLILMSEVGYYLSMKDLLVARQQIAESLQPGGTLMLVHWTHYVADYPLTGDQVHEVFLEEKTWSATRHNRTADYRLDVLMKQ